MKTIQIESRTEYFAIKKSIFKAIEIFSRKQSDNAVNCVCKEMDVDLIIRRETIINFLGYDFRAKKFRFKNDCLLTGKLGNKTKVMTLGYRILTDELKEVNVKLLPIQNAVEQLPPQICYNTNEPCKHECQGLCKESC